MKSIFSALAVILAATLLVVVLPFSGADKVNCIKHDFCYTKSVVFKESPSSWKKCSKCAAWSCIRDGVVYGGSGCKDDRSVCKIGKNEVRPHSFNATYAFAECKIASDFSGACAQKLLKYVVTSRRISYRPSATGDCNLNERSQQRKGVPFIPAKVSVSKTRSMDEKNDVTKTPAKLSNTLLSKEENNDAAKTPTKDEKKDGAKTPTKNGNDAVSNAPNKDDDVTKAPAKVSVSKTLSMDVMNDVPKNPTKNGNDTVSKAPAQDVPTTPAKAKGEMKDGTKTPTKNRNNAVSNVPSNGMKMIGVLVICGIILVGVVIVVCGIILL